MPESEEEEAGINDKVTGRGKICSIIWGQEIIKSSSRNRVSRGVTDSMTKMGNCTCGGDGNNDYNTPLLHYK